ncbi:MAG: exodeoxyribonuclease III [Planctomycetota bacterium]|nr:MAG: exodeoxyribonuclease III [Planctomycetota bacterium]
MLIATFNANSVRARLPIILDWLGANAPDVLCVQETKVQDADFPVDAFRDIGYHAVFRGQKSYNGVAVISRSVPDDVTYGLDDGGPPDEPRLICAVCGGVPIVNTYVPQGVAPDSPKFAYKVEWFARLKAFFARRYSPDKPLVWAGDLNVAREPIDVYNPDVLENHVCFHADVRKALNDVVEWGFVDVFRERCPEPGHYTFWDYRDRNALERKIGWRLDYIFATKPLAEKCASARIDIEPRLRERPSDHTFVIADFNV